MLLAIKGNVNNVFWLQKPDCITIEKYLKNIEYNKFKKQKAAYNWMNINTPTEIPKFQECIKTLKEKGIIPKLEKVTSCSSIQNIEDDNERKQRYEERKKERKALKEKGIIKVKKEREIDYSKIYAEETPNDIKKAPGEFKLDTIDTSLQLNSRSSFLHYIFNGGDEIAFGDFKGTILKVEGKRILFKEIYICFFEDDGNCIDGKEDHVWIYDIKEFLKMNVKPEDKIKFNALAYAYRRRDGTIDFSLKAPQRIQYIKEYDLPTDEELNLQTFKNLECEICLFNEHCYGNCVK